MKKLLLAMLLLWSLQTIAQKYTVVVEPNDRVSIITPTADRYSVLRTTTNISLLQNSNISIIGITGKDPITLQNFDFVASNIPTQVSLLALYNYLKDEVFAGKYIKPITKSSANATDTAIPTNFRSGLIEWTNAGTGTVTITTSDGRATTLTANFPARTFPIADSVIYSGYTVTLAGGATIQWTFNQ